MGDLVAQWKVPLADKVHVIEFEHGTTTGKRIIRVDKKVNKSSHGQPHWAHLINLYFQYLDMSLI